MRDDLLIVEFREKVLQLISFHELVGSTQFYYKKKLDIESRGKNSPIMHSSESKLQRERGNRF